MPEVLQEAELRTLIRQECRAAVKDELFAIMATCLNAGIEAERSPWWDMGVPQLVGEVNAMESQTDLLDFMDAERDRPEGARPNVLAAARVRLQELDAADDTARGS